MKSLSADDVFEKILAIRIPPELIVGAIAECSAESELVDSDLSAALKESMEDDDFRAMAIRCVADVMIAANIAQTLQAVCGIFKEVLDKMDIRPSYCAEPEARSLLEGLQRRVFAVIARDACSEYVARGVPESVIKERLALIEAEIA